MPWIGIGTRPDIKEAVSREHDKVLRAASQAEMAGGLKRKQLMGPWVSAFGLLPPGRGGRPLTKRGAVPRVSNVVAELRNFEAIHRARVQRWTPNFDWIPRPFSAGQKYVLILFSGHRRCADLGSRISWTSSLQPICVDLAWRPSLGDVLDDHVFLQMIKARRIVAGPPCETFSMARWLPQPDLPAAPRPLRDACEP